MNDDYTLEDYKDDSQEIFDYDYEDEDIENKISKQYLMNVDKMMFLYLYTENEDLKVIYDNMIEKHNFSIMNEKFIDAGFDVLNPNQIECVDGSICKLNLEIKCSAKIYTDSWKKYYTGYYIHPRSSIIKTPLRLANSTGIIDSGYRNNIMAVFDCKDNYTIEKHSRLVQICGPGLCPIYVIRVNSEKELSEKTERNLGGFGSTGI